MAVKWKANTREASKNMTFHFFCKVKIYTVDKKRYFYLFLSKIVHYCNAKCVSLVTPGHRCTKWWTFTFNRWFSNVVSPVEGLAERTMATTNSMESSIRSRVTLTTDKCSSISTDSDTIPYTEATRTNYGCAGPTKIRITNQGLLSTVIKGVSSNESLCGCYCLQKSGGNSLVWNKYTITIYIEWYTSLDVQEARLF